MARSKSNSSNIYSQHDHKFAEDLSARSLRNEFVVPSDSAGVIPDKLAAEIPGVEVKHLKTDTGSPDGSKTHGGGIEGGSKSVTHGKAAHEKTPVDFTRAGAEAFREQRGTAKDED